MNAAEHDRGAFVVLSKHAHHATRHIAPLDSAVQLYRAARDAAQQRIPGPLGVAVAGVLADGAYRRGLSGHAGSLGEPETLLALAAAVLALPEGTPT